ncbi:MAG: type II toxin-antitoxin system VapC family toxin [Bacteroidales bacterium]|nr:type II toxin-antitoxin system VapC family toxin [Bacteroidales bacterium]
MRRFLLDTCVLIWLLSEDRRVKEISEDIRYFQGDYAVSTITIMELLYLIQSGKLKIDISFDELINLLKSRNIKLEETNRESLRVLSELPFFKKHPDPFDRVIISQAISENRTLISGDRNFILYKDARLLTI